MFQCLSFCFDHCGQIRFQLEGQPVLGELIELSVPSMLFIYLFVFEIDCSGKPCQSDPSITPLQSSAMR